MELQSDCICNLEILKDATQATVIKDILRNFCEQSLESILVD